ncbi:MAG: CDP-alcohol phosphatidyltransferase family protein [Acidobacteriota bacterium]
MKLTLANQLTILRMGLVPVLVILVIYGYFGWALLVFLVAGVTDALDGLSARIRRERTRLGTMLDPLADKLLITASLVVLSTPNPELTVRIPVWVAILAISRDAGILIVVLVINLAVRRSVFSPTILGKATTVIQLLTILWLFWCNYRAAPLAVTDVLIGLMVVFTIASGLHYIYRARRIVGEVEGEENG